MKKLLALLLACLLLFTGCDFLSLDNLFGGDPNEGQTPTVSDNSGIGESTSSVGAYGTLADIPAFSGNPYVALNGNTPKFTAEEKTDVFFERYAPLDSFGRCGECFASVGEEGMPADDREEIGSVTPSGWKQAKYDIVSGKYLYNRCHLIGFQLTGENANERNLITGTQYLNIEGMLPFENMIARYVKETENHVLYRVTPIYNGDNAVASGVLLEGYSVEDEGDGISFAVFCYNVQPGISIDYATGASALSGEALPEEPSYPQGEIQYVLNTSSRKVHLPTCSSVTDMKEHNKQETYETIASLLSRGFTACGACKPNG